MKAFIPYSCAHSVIFNHCSWVGKSDKFPVKNFPFGPGGKGSSSRLVRIYSLQTIERKTNEMLSASAS